MKLHPFRGISIVALAAGLLGGVSCIPMDYSLGSDYIATDQQFDIFTAEFPLEDISLQVPDSLSGYSQTRITVGAVRDDDFGLTRRGSAVTLVPIYDSLDFGKNAKFNYFHMVLVPDTISVLKDEDAFIHQGLNIYELSEPIGDRYSIHSKLPHGTKRITQGVPLYNGGTDTVGVFFTKEFGEKFMQITLDDTKDMESYTKKFPGIFIETDDPVGNGGRVNLFSLQLQYDVSDYHISGNYASLGFSAEYDGTVKDTSFLFYFSPDKFYDVDSLIYNASSDLPQYCLNVATHESGGLEGKVSEKILIEGAGGLCPVLSATEIREKVRLEIAKRGNPDEASINRATITLPFEFPENYLEMQFYPQILSPTCRIVNDEGEVSFAGLTDSSNSSENQGDVNRSLMVYSPDITYHTQTLLKLKDTDKIHNYDVWFLTMAYETVVSKTSAAEQNQMSDYMNMMLYSSYYGNMYGGYGGYGYGGYGYGGYGGYGNYYSNYYSYALMASMYGSSSSSSSVVAMLDTDRYYHGILRGPADPVARPMMRITFALPKTAE